MFNNKNGNYLSITFANGTASTVVNDEPKTFKSERTLPFASSPVYNGTIIDATRLTNGEDVKAVYRLALDLKNINHNFEPGDTIGILPSNNENEVDQLLFRLNLTPVATKTYSICIFQGTSKKNPAVPLHIPTQGTLRELFIKNVDIRSPPKKLFLKSLIPYVSKAKEVEELHHICSPKGSQDYVKFITQNQTLIGLLTYFSSCSPPIALLLEYLPALQPRPYSISSSPLAKDFRNELQITFSVVKLDKNTKGVCSGWLETVIKNFNNTKLQQNCNVTTTLEEDLEKLTLNLNYKLGIPFYFRKSNNFHLPLDPTTPIIMIGPGTGVAPFVGFLQHRHLQLKMESNTNFGTSWLFYGCRYSNRDFLYKPELEEFLQEGTLTKLFTCYSREGSTKTYVQDIIKEHGRNVIEKIVRENAVVYVCGDAKNMANDIRQAIVSCLMDVEGWCSTDSEAYLKHLQQTERYIQDVWL